MEQHQLHFILVSILMFICVVQKNRIFFSSDINSVRRPESLKKYEELFKNATIDHKVIGEASTSYLRSKEAIPAILKYNPDAKFLVSIRNPIEMVASVHSQLLKNGRETERSLEHAWSLQNDRRKGKHLPIGCIEPDDLQYGKMCLIGSQLERLFSFVRKENLLVLTLEDIEKNTRLEYRRILEFLEIKDDGKSEFSIKNRRSSTRSLFLSLAVNQLALMKIKLGFKRNTGIGALIQNVNKISKIGIQKNSVDFENELCNYFKNDVKKIESIINRNLNYWLK